MRISLDQMQIGQRCTVEEIRLTGALRRRLLDLGLMEGTCVAWRQRAPRGVAVAYELRGAVIALRAVDARQVLGRLEA